MQGGLAARAAPRRAALGWAGVVKRQVQGALLPGRQDGHAGAAPSRPPATGSRGQVAEGASDGTAGQYCDPPACPPAYLARLRRCRCMPCVRAPTEARRLRRPAPLRDPPGRPRCPDRRCKRSRLSDRPIAAAAAAPAPPPSPAPRSRRGAGAGGGAAAAADEPHCNGDDLRGGLGHHQPCCGACAAACCAWGAVVRAAALTAGLRAWEPLNACSARCPASGRACACERATAKPCWQPPRPMQPWFMAQACHPPASTGRARNGESRAGGRSHPRLPSPQPAPSCLLPCAGRVRDGQGGAGGRPHPHRLPRRRVRPAGGRAVRLGAGCVPRRRPSRAEGGWGAGCSATDQGTCPRACNSMQPASGLITHHPACASLRRRQDIAAEDAEYRQTLSCLHLDISAAASAYHLTQATLRPRISSSARL